MAGNTVTLTFAGDAKGAQKAAQQTEKANEGVASSVTSAADAYNKSGKSAQEYESRITAIGSGVTGVTDAVDSAGAAVQGLSDVMNYGRERANRLARAQADVEQALLDQRQATIDLEQSVVDLSQAQADGRQAALDEGQARIDARQALLDQKTAQDEYNKAVKEYGAGSAEAQQAQIDLAQATMDHRQANEDLKQAQIDANQAVVDGKQYALDGAQALRDGKDAQLNYNEALHEANPSGLQQTADVINVITPLLSGLVGVIGVVTAAQWAWNAAQAVNPAVWVAAAIVALIAVIVLLIKHWDKVKAAGVAAWNWIKDAAGAVGRWFAGPFANFFTRSWDKIKGVWIGAVGWFRGLGGRLGSALTSVAAAIFRPFRSAFNRIADAWNNTIGSLSFTFPSWVPGIGGNSISVPNLPKFHAGGIVPGGPGREVLVALQGGERVSSSASEVNRQEWIPVERGDALLDMVLSMLAERVDRKGGRASQLGIRVIA
jgi:hypothetical protein